MKEKYLTNARIIDPKNQIDEMGGLIIDAKGLIKAAGKKVTNGNLPAAAEKIDLKKQILMPGLVDMRVFVGEPGYEYKENFKRLKKALGSINTNVPTLYKQYADLCEEGGIQFCAYNIDYDFSNCIDSFIVVDISKIKESQRKRYIDT